MMNKKGQVARYLIFDFLSAAISWTIFYIFRKAVIEPQLFGMDIPIEFTKRYFLGLLFIPLFGSFFTTSLVFTKTFITAHA
jgi:hypothetical protein